MRAFDESVRVILNQGGSSCFYGDQLIITKRGKIPISSVIIGDICLSYNIESGAEEWNTVTDVMPQMNDKPCYRVKLKNGYDIIATEDHKFFYDGGWISLKNIVSLWKNNKHGKSLEKNP